MISWYSVRRNLEAPSLSCGSFDYRSLDIEDGSDLCISVSVSVSWCVITHCSTCGHGISHVCGNQLLWIVERSVHDIDFIHS
jgi:hypothetical protein